MSLFYDIRTKKIYSKRKLISLYNLTKITRNKIKKEKSANKVLNIIEFIKKKNRFFIKNTFDAKGAREFLTSKEIAMGEIKLNDEIVEENNINKKEYSTIQKNFLQLDLMYSSKSIKNSKSSIMTAKEEISSKKSKKKVKRKSLEENIIQEKENKKMKKCPKKMKYKINRKMESNCNDKKEKILLWNTKIVIILMKKEYINFI